MNSSFPLLLGGLPYFINRKILDELAEQKKAMEELIEKGKRDAAAEAAARKAIEDALKKRAKSIDDHKEVCEDDPKLEKEGFSDLFDQVLDSLKDFAERLSKLLK